MFNLFKKATWSKCWITKRTKTGKRQYIVYWCPKCYRETIIPTNYCPDCGKRLRKE